MPVVKHGFLVERVADIPHVLREAFRVARSGRPGPVVVDLPKDVQAANLRWRPSPVVQLSAHQVPNSMPIPRTRLGAAVQLIRRAKRPLVYAGGGVGMAGAVELFRRFVRQTQTPTVTTLKAIGLMPPDEPLGMGMLGMHVLEHANKAVQRCDLLIALGARFDDRVTGKLEGFAPHARVLHIDIDAAELGKVRAADVGICADLKPALRQLNDQLTEPLAVDAWRRECAELKAEHAWDYEPPFDAIYAPRLLRDLSAAQGANGVLTCDVGQHQMWVAQHCGVHHPTNHLSSGGLGTMGFGLPAAIGAQLGRPAASVINVTGDGSIMMNLQELATIGRYRLPVKIVLLDNSGLGMVRQWQQLFLGERYSETDLSDNLTLFRWRALLASPPSPSSGAPKRRSRSRRYCRRRGRFLRTFGSTRARTSGRSSRREQTTQRCGRSHVMNVRLEIQLANKPGALVRVLGLAERRGFAPFRAGGSFGPTTQMVHLTVSDDRPVEHLVRQIQKLYDVRHVERRR